MKKTKICVIGVGNTLRGDDGVGAYVCDEVTKWASPPDTLVVHQLQTEMVEDLLHYDAIIVVDATAEASEVEILPVKEATSPTVSSHYLNAAMLKAIAEKVYDKPLTVYTCAIPGEDFSLREGLSPLAKDKAKKALTQLQSLVTAGSPF